MAALSHPLPRTTRDADHLQSHVYLPVTDDDIAFVVLTPPRQAARRNCGLVLCPPFGWEELSAHRMLGAWARELAHDGYTIARVSYPGTGDSSGGPNDPDRLDAWIASVRRTAAWLREREGVEHVVALGVGFGGIIAQLAAARSTQLSGTILWATPRRGRDFLRQLRAFSRFETAEAFDGLPDPPALPEGALEAGGFLVSADTAAALSSIDLSLETVENGLTLGVLMLGPDDRAADEPLRAALCEQGIDVTTATGAGYSTLTSHPQEADLTPEVTSRVRDWLDARSSPQRSDAHERSAPAGPADTQQTIICGGHPVVERPMQIDVGDIALAGILTQPAQTSSPVCAVFVNAGAIHRVGPNRMYVDTARRWAALGVSSLRLDLEGIGESAGADRAYVEMAPLHDPRLIDQIAAAMDALQARGIAERFVIVGLCSGAYSALHLAARDPRVEAVQLLNLAVIEWDAGLAPTRSLRAISLRSLANLRRADTRARLWATLRWLVGHLRDRLAQPGHAAAPMRDRVAGHLERLRSSQTDVLFMFAAREPLEQDLIRDGLMDGIDHWPNATVAHVAVASHTLRPCWAQQRTAEIVDEHLLRVLGDRRPTAATVTQSGIGRTPTPPPGETRTAVSVSVPINGT